MRDGRQGEPNVACFLVAGFLLNSPFPEQCIGDIVIGSVLGPSSQRANECRIASFFAGIPETVPVHTVNR